MVRAMADPIITAHDSLGVLIPQGVPISFPEATAGTPNAGTVIEWRNNDADAGPVDPARAFKITVLGRLLGDTADPTTVGTAYLAGRSLQIRVTAVSGGATAPITGWHNLGNGSAASLGTIPDGGTVTTEHRTVVSLSAALQEVELFIQGESTQSTPLPQGTFETIGNHVYIGVPGGFPDRDFTQVSIIVGDFSINAPPDDKVNTPTSVTYTLRGEPFVTAPITPEVTFDDQDGDAATLAAGEEYIAGLSLDGTATYIVTKGSKVTEPAGIDDRPTPPEDQIISAWVTVPFGLEIDTVVQVIQDSLGFFEIVSTSGLDVTFAGGIGSVGDNWIDDPTPTTVTFSDDQTTTVWLRPASGFELKEVEDEPTDSRSMALWDITTAGGAVTVTDSRRRLGTNINGGATSAIKAAGSLTFNDPLGPQTVTMFEGSFTKLDMFNRGVGDDSGNITPSLITQDLEVGLSAGGFYDQGWSLSASTSGGSPKDFIVVFGVEQGVGSEPVIIDATNATPVVITFSEVLPIFTGVMFDVVGVGGNLAANGSRMGVVVSPTEMALYDLSNNPVVGSGDYTSGGVVPVIFSGTSIAHQTISSSTLTAESAGMPSTRTPMVAGSRGALYAANLDGNEALVVQTASLGVVRVDDF